jgi:thymidylate kinase
MKPNFTHLHDFPGKLIIFEWPDGSGKSTQAKRLKKKIQNDGGTAVIVSWKDAPYFRDYFIQHDLKRGVDVISPESHLFLQVADMLSQIERTIIPNLKKGHTVIMDRSLPTVVIRGLTLGFTLDQLENGLLWFTKSIYRELFERATTIFLSVDAGKTMKNMEKRAKKEGDSGEGTLLSLHMIQNFHYLPSGERLTNKVKKRLLQKLQETYVTSYHHYFSHHPAITIDANQDKKDVFKQITSALSPATSSSFTRGSFRQIKKREKVSA